MEARYRKAIYDALVTLPAFKADLFQALSIKKLASFEGRAPEQLGDAQMLAIDKFFYQINIVLRALDEDSGYSTGKADDLTTVFATLNPELKRVIDDELPKICSTIAAPYCSNIQRCLTTLFEWSARTLPLGRAGDDSDFARYLENDYERELARTWVAAVARTFEQLKRMPKRFCADEIAAYKDKFSSHPELEKCRRMSRRLRSNSTAVMQSFDAAGVPRPPFGIDQDIFLFFEAPLSWDVLEQISPEKRDAGVRESIRALLEYADDGVTKIYNESSLDSAARLREKENERNEYESTVDSVETFLDDEAMWWMIEQGPVEFGLFFERKKLLRKYQVNDRTVVESGELGLLLEEIQIAFCLDRPATVAALSRAALEYVMKLHSKRIGDKVGLGEYKDAIFSTDQKWLKWNINVPLEEDEKKLKSAVDEIYRFGNDVLHANHLNKRFDSKQMSVDKERLNKRMQENCLVHIPAVVELLLPRALGRV